MNEAQVVEKLLALTLKAAKDLHKVNGKALITFESPKHGSFKSNAQVQAMLRIEGFWLVELEPVDNRQGGVVPKKGTVVLVSGLSDDPQKDMDKCPGYKCPMVVPGTNHHVVVLCQPSSRKLHGAYTQAMVLVEAGSATGQCGDHWVRGTTGIGGCQWTMRTCADQGRCEFEGGGGGGGGGKQRAGAGQQLRAQVRSPKTGHFTHGFD